MALTKTQVSELYVAIFNRASEGTGNTYWQGEGSAAEVAQKMLDTVDAKEYFGTAIDDDKAFIEHIYTNTLGKTYAEDAEGIDFWVARLANGESRGEVVAALVVAATDPKYAGTAAQKQFLNRVEVSNYAADNIQNVPENYKQTLGFNGDLDVTENPDTISPAKKAVEELAVETDGGSNLLTEALEALQAAQVAKADFLKGLELDTDFDGEYDAEEDHEAGKADEDTVEDYFTTAAGRLVGNDDISLNVGDYTDLEKTALQDVDMQTAVTKAQGNVTVATAAAKPGMTALISKAQATQADYRASLLAEGKASDKVDAEEAAFTTANITHDVAKNINDVVFAADYNPAADNGKVVIYNGKAYTGETGKTLKQLTEDKTVERVAELEAAKAAHVAAENQVASLLEALKKAVGDIYVLEAGGHSIKDLGADAVKADGNIILTAADVEVYKTAADAKKKVVEQEVEFKAVTGIVDVADTVSITIDGVTINFSANATNEQVAAEVAGKEFPNWIVTASDPANENLIFTAKTPSVKELEAGKITVTVTGNGAMTAPEVGAVATVDLGEFFKAPATNADNLATELDALKALENAIADFQAARDAKVELDQLEEAIEKAEEALTNSGEDGGLDVSLRTGDMDFSSADDVYLFNPAFNNGIPVSLDHFGARGEDKIFFGSSFTGGLIEIDDTKKDNGDVSALDIFWLQNGTDVELYVEQKSFAGNGTGTSDMVQITLTGVNGDNLSLDADGFLTIA